MNLSKIVHVGKKSTYMSLALKNSSLKSSTDTSSSGVFVGRVSLVWKKESSSASMLGTAILEGLFSSSTDLIVVRVDLAVDDNMRRY